MLKIVVVEDNIECLNAISAYINGFILMNEIEGKVVLTTTDPDNVERYIKGAADSPNVFFIDIDLNTKTNGIRLACRLKQILPKPYIVFITRHIKFQQSAFRIHVFDFLLKPVKKVLLGKCLKDIYSELRYCNAKGYCEDNDFIIIKSGYREIFIKKHEILFIEKQGNKAQVNTINGQYSCYLPLEHFQKLLNRDDEFFRCHKSFIINKNYIREIRLNKLEIELISGKTCSLSRKFRKGLSL